MNIQVGKIYKIKPVCESLCEKFVNRKGKFIKITYIERLNNKFGLKA